MGEIGKYCRPFKRENSFVYTAKHRLTFYVYFDFWKQSSSIMFKEFLATIRLVWKERQISKRKQKTQALNQAAIFSMFKFLDIEKHQRI